MGMMLMSMIGSAALILGGIAGAGLLLYHSSMLSPVRIGVVFPQGSKTMSQAISLVETMNSFSSVCEIKEMHDVLKIEMTNIGHLLQMFTDYSNGYYFRRLLQEKGYEGYIFNETNCPIPIVGSDTICIFKSTKFLPPCVEAIYTEKEAEAS